LTARRLLVGVAEAGELNEPRRFLLDHLELLAALGVEVQVAMFGDGPLRSHLEAIADVRVMADLPPRSPAGLVQSLARRVSPDLADRVHDVRASADLDWLKAPDCIHVHGPKAAPVLRYARDPAVPVTTYAHHVDFSIAGLQPLDRERLLSRTDRFFAADPEVAADLVAAGVDRGRIGPARGDLQDPAPPPAPAVAVAQRREHLFPPGRVVVGVMPVADWLDAPDLTLAVAWEVERLAGEGGKRGPLLYWYGMPGAGEPRWSVEFDIDRMGLESVRLDTARPEWAEVIDLVDLVVLPSRTTGSLPDGFAELAARHARPVACWAGHPDADEVERWGGTVVPLGDVSAMAAHVHRVCATREALHRAKEAAWQTTLADVERLTPLSIILPGGTP